MRLPLLVVPFSLLTVAVPLTAQLVPHKQPRAGELVDSAAFAAFVRARAGDTPGNADLSLVFDSAGRLKSARAVEGSLPAPLQSVLADSVAAYLRPQAPWSGGTWWVRLGVRAGPELALRTERCHVQGPTPVSSGDVGAILAASGNPHGGRIEIRFLVSESGRVLRAEPGPGTTLSPVAAARLAERVRYAPGTVDGEPQPMWTAIRLERR